jgi:phage-related protein
MRNVIEILKKFYAVDTTEDVVIAQNRQIEKLQIELDFYCRNYPYPYPYPQPIMTKAREDNNAD